MNNKNKQSDFTTFLVEVNSSKLKSGKLYARYNIGLFFKDQALTFINSLRRILLTNIPGFAITEINFFGMEHEFSPIPGVAETPFDIIDNLNKIVFTYNSENFNYLFEDPIEIQGFLNIQGPKIVTAGDIKLPPNFGCAVPSQHIAFVSWDGELSINFKIKLIFPKTSQSIPIQQDPISIDTDLSKTYNQYNVPNPITDVNFYISEFDPERPQYIEYIVVDIVTDGSIQPKVALKFSINQLTNLFYNFNSLDF